jgi:colicin import membrane protein
MTMRSGITISTLAHALLLAWGVLTFTAKPLDGAPTESLPVDIISATEFSQMTAGVKTAPKAEAPKPLVEKIGESKPVKEVTPKITEKQEIQSASAEPTPKLDTPPKPDAKPEKPEPIAEATKKEPAKPLPPKKPPQPKLDLSKVENKLALLDKREQQRHAATGATLNPTPSLGTSTGRAASLSQSEIDAITGRLREHLKGCWDVPAGLADARELFVMVRFQLKRDGTLSGDPVVTNRVTHPAFQVAAESAVRAVAKCTPYTFLPAAKYDLWSDLEVRFDPRDMFGG